MRITINGLDVEGDIEDIIRFIRTYYGVKETKVKRKTYQKEWRTQAVPTTSQLKTNKRYYKRLRKTEIKKIISLYKRGVSRNNIAFELNRSYQSVCNVIRRYGYGAFRDL